MQGSFSGFFSHRWPEPVRPHIRWSLSHHHPHRRSSSESPEVTHTRFTTTWALSDLRSPITGVVWADW